MTDYELPAARFRKELTALREAAELPTDTSFVSEVKVPGDMAMAFSTDRPELLMLAKPKALNAEQVKLIYDLIGAMMKTNRALRMHIKGVARLLDIIDDIAATRALQELAGLPDMLSKTLAFCNFDDELAQEVANERFEG